MDLFGFWIVLAAFLVGANCSLLGSVLVLRGEAMLSDAISHAVLPGIVLIFLFTNTMHPLVLSIGAIIAGILTTFLISLLHQQVHVPTDVAIGITFTSFFALGIMLISLYTDKADLDVGCVLSGKLHMVSLDGWIYDGRDWGPKPVYLLGGLLVFNFLFLVLCYPMLFVSSFDPAFALSLGINTRFWHYVLMMVTSITTVVAFKAVGAVLVVAFFIVPPATAYLLTERLPDMIIYSLLINVIIASGGYEIATLLNGPVAGSIVALTGVLFSITFFVYKYNVYSRNLGRCSE